MRRIRRRCDGEAGFTLIELLVASAMGVVVMGAVASMLIAALHTQPRISGEADNISTARWELERITREIRNGVAVKQATASQLSFEGYVRSSSCGGSGSLPSGTPSIKCEITYTCTSTSCSRTESAPGTYTGTARKVFSGINSGEVFSYSPNATEATFVKATLRLPNPQGSGSLTVSDGASLRNATLGN
jgi:prepilin-type N-terminal cleavage/methylation domain-containing protein